MKKIVCDTCGSEHAKTYQYGVDGYFNLDSSGKLAYKYIDLCINCVQDWVLKHQKKLSEATNESESKGGKSVLHG